MTSSPDNPIMKDLLNEDKLKKAMAQSIQDQKKLSPDNTVEKILSKFVGCKLPHPKYMTCEWCDELPEAKQSLDSHYLSIFLELVGEDEYPNEHFSTVLRAGEVERYDSVVCRDRFRAELRTALQDRLGGKNE